MVFRSPYIARTKVTNYFVFTADAQVCSFSVLLGLSAAFDTVDHTILIDCLEHWGSAQSFLELTTELEPAELKQVISAARIVEISLTVTHFLPPPLRLMSFILLDTFCIVCFYHILLHFPIVGFPLIYES